MRPGPWLLELLLLIGPVLLVGVVAVPLLLGAFAVVVAIKSENGAKSPLVWVTAVIAVIGAVIIWPGYVQTVENCKSLEADATRTQDMADFMESLGEEHGFDPDAARLAALENGCNDLVIRW